MSLPEPPIADLASAVAHRVRVLRTERGWSADQLARRLTDAGFATRRAALANFENGRRRDVTVGELFAFARVFRVPPILLFGEPLDVVPVVPTGKAPDDQTPAPVAVVTVAELLDWIAGAWVPNAIADTEDEASPSDYSLAAEPLAAHRRHTELLDRVIAAYVDLPAAHGLDAYREPLDELARHRWSMRTRAAFLARTEHPERASLWRLPDITPDELAPAVQAAEQRVSAAYPRSANTPTTTPEENER